VAHFHECLAWIGKIVGRGVIGGTGLAGQFPKQGGAVLCLLQLLLELGVVGGDFVNGAGEAGVLTLE
jgi:hypothetical protein